MREYIETTLKALLYVKLKDLRATNLQKHYNELIDKPVSTVKSLNTIHKSCIN